MHLSAQQYVPASGASYMTFSMTRFASILITHGCSAWVEKNGTLFGKFYSWCLSRLVDVYCGICILSRQRKATAHTNVNIKEV